MSTCKETNPKDLIGIKKVPVSTVPLPVITEIGLAMLEGACKYGRHNYRVMGVSATVYFDAVMRHMFAWFEGEDLDPDSNLSHITKALGTLAVLRDAMIRDMWTDDRPPSTSNFIQKQNEAAAKILERYPNRVKPYCQKDIEDKIDIKL